MLTFGDLGNGEAGRDPFNGLASGAVKNFLNKIDIRPGVIVTNEAAAGVLTASEAD